ncbi:hypothetical protein HW555_014372, partial [Spodoptera exigua]
MKANASDGLERIKEMLSSEATVYREGIRKDIPAEEIVIGDIVFLEAGDNVPADLRIIEADNLRIQESALTGEADSVEKETEPLTNPDTPLAEQINIAFASTPVTSGSGKGIVVATGAQTEIGKISTEVNNTEERKTPLMNEIDVLSLAVVTMIVGSIPEGLPATTSVVLAMGVSDMAKNKHTIVKTLPAVETLGSVDVVATDKTGTLTKNEMTVKDIIFADRKFIVTGDGYQPIGQIIEQEKPILMDERLKLFLEVGYEANDTVLVQEADHWKINGEPTDGAFLTLYHKMFNCEVIPEYDEIDMLPFDSDYRYIAKLVNDRNKQRLLLIKGSPDKLFAMANAQDPSFADTFWNQQVRSLSAEGKRVVAVGYKKVSANIQEITHELLNEGIDLLGIAGIIDPPREEVIAALKEMNQAGVEVKMITGQELDILAGEDFKQAVINNQVFARTTPKNKMEIIEALQESGKVTAMTGDGVNDAPALKRADIGVAMGRKGTDVAKDSADMILTDDNFGTMSVAIREGRRIYDNIKKIGLFFVSQVGTFAFQIAKAISLNEGEAHMSMFVTIGIKWIIWIKPSMEWINRNKPKN